MKSVGITRQVDPLGRIVIPKELRRTLKIETGTSLEFFVEEDFIILRKYVPNRACIVTGEILSGNVEYSGGIILSPQGSKQLLDELQKNAKKDRSHV